jgi:hypothetical protein
LPSAARMRGALVSSPIPAAAMYWLPDRQVVHRGLPIFAAFFPEAHHTVIIQVPMIGHPESGHGADAGTGIGQHAEHGVIAEADEVTGVDLAEQLARLLDGELGGLCLQ